MEMGKPQQATDLVIAAIAIRLGEELVTMDKDFKDIAEATRKLGYDLKLRLIPSSQEGGPET
jgi:predicted nuclease of predicted toxin-antitoxin system